MHIIIIGGGSAGLALTQALHKNNIKVSCFEREPKATGPEHGYRVEINDDACDALRYCLPPHLYQRFEESTESGYKITFTDEQLRPIEDLIGHHDYRPVDRFLFREFMQHGLEGILHIGKKFINYEERDDKVIAFFEDGSSVEGDLLIGADGANSKVRMQLLPHADRVRTGVITIICKTRHDLTLIPHQHGSVIKCPNGHCMFIADYHPLSSSSSSSSPPESYVFFALSCHEDDFIKKDKPFNEFTQEELQEECIARAVQNNFHPLLIKLIKEGRRETYVPVDLRTSERIGGWESKRITLAGDALHSMTPFRGTGANTALRDAAVLSEIIIHSLSNGYYLGVPILKAIGKYEEEVRERGFDAVEKSLKACLWVHGLNDKKNENKR